MIFLSNFKYIPVNSKEGVPPSLDYLALVSLDGNTVINVAILLRFHINMYFRVYPLVIPNDL